MRVALVFGGRSSEHEVSVVSARAVRRALESRGHEVMPLGIAKDGLWADPAASAEVLDRSDDRTDRVVPFDGSATVAAELLAGGVDVVFPILHGPFGEDGTIQGMLEMLNLPYVGCGVMASAVCMDKGVTKRLLVHAGLPTPDWVEVSRAEFRDDPAAVVKAAARLETPLFVKPSRLGSSVGITKVATLQALPDALDSALGHDSLAVVERAVDAREIEVPVLGNRKPRAALPGEVVPGHEFYDYEDKYLDDSCTLVTPAEIEASLTQRVQALAVEVYRTLRCEGMARVDLFLERGSGRLLVNEVNTIPGFTPISMFPKLWQVSGMNYSKLVEELLNLALDRHRSRVG